MPGFVLYWVREMTVIDDPRDWMQIGKGKYFLYFATLEEVYSILRASLPDKYGPYTIIRTTPVKVGERHQFEPCEYELARFPEFKSEGVHGHGIVLRSAVLSPELKLARGTYVHELLRLSGLIHIWDGSLLANGVLKISRIEMTDRTYCPDTKEEVVHREYVRIFNAVKRGLKKILHYPQVYMSADGRVLGISDDLGISEGVYDRYVKGEFVLEQPLGL